MAEANRVSHVEVEQYHASLPVAGLSAAVHFYASRLGFLHAFDWDEPPRDCLWQLRDHTVLDLDGYALNFGRRLPASKGTERG